MTVHPSNAHLRFFLIASSVLAIPGLFFSFIGVVFIVPPFLGLFGSYLIYRYYRSLKPSSITAYRIRTHTLSMMMNLASSGFMFLLMIMFSFQPGASTPWFLPAAAAYSVSCIVVAYRGYAKETGLAMPPPELSDTLDR